MYFKQAADLANIEKILTDVVDWLWDAGQPYVGYLWGSEKEGKAQTRAWLRRRQSELSLDKITLLMRDQVVLGGYLAMSGKDLLLARKYDLIEVMKVARGTNNTALVKRLGASRELFGTIDDQSYYLSRIGVRSEYRGKGLGRKLLEHCLASDRIGSYDLLKLHVSTDNQSAIALYLSHNFTIVRECTSTKAGMAYYTMMRDMRRR